MSAPLQLVDTTLGDAAWARSKCSVGSAQVAPVLARIDRAGFTAVEVALASLFQVRSKESSLNPWQHLQAVSQVVSATPILVAVHGQGLVGPRGFADDTVRLFITQLATAGIGIFRIYDQLNDLRNLETAVASALAAGKTVEGCLCYTPGPAYDLNSWPKLASELVSLGCHYVTVRDPGALLTPQAARELVAALRKAVEVPIGLSLQGSATAAMAAMAAIEAGATRVDTALTARGWPIQAPSAAGLVAAFAGGDHDTGLELARLAEVELELVQLGQAAVADIDGVQASALRYQVPAALIDEVAEELGRHRAEIKLETVLEELPRLLDELGQPPLEASIRRMVASQAVLNVVAGDRYATVTQALKEYLHGLWGRPPGDVDRDIRRHVLGREEALTIRPADLLEPQVEAARGRLQKSGVEASDHNVLISIFNPGLGASYFKADGAPGSPPEPVEDDEESTASGEDASSAEDSGPPQPPPPSGPVASEFDVEVEGEVFRVRVTGAGASVAPAAAPAAGPPSGGPAAAVGPGVVLAPMQGLIVKLPVKKGDPVKLGDVVAVLEAMKMQNDIVATNAGSVVEIHVKEGEVVTPNQPLLTVR